MSETLLLGAGGTLQSTFAAIRDAKRQVTISLVDGNPIAGFVTGEPGQGYVVVRQDVESSTSVTDVLVQYAAIATVRVVLNTGRIAGTGLAEDKLQNLKGRVLWVTLARSGHGQEMVKGRLVNLDHKAIELGGDEATADAQDGVVPPRPDVVLTRLPAGEPPRRVLLANVQEISWQQ